MRKNTKQILFTIGVWILHILLLILVMEGSLRVYGLHYMHSVHQYFYQKNVITPGTRVILCLGESSTAGLGVSDGDTYPAQLERRLRTKYPHENFRVVVPQHIGQNTSQMANRLPEYVKVYKPAFVIMMVGVNNEWSLAESNIINFLPSSAPEKKKIALMIWLNHFRLFKVGRYLYLKYIMKEQSPYIDQLKGMNYVWGGPELVRWPPEKWTYAFSQKYKEAFVKLWHHDVSDMIWYLKAKNIPVMLMTYHLLPGYLPEEEWIRCAHEDSVPLVRNDRAFRELIAEREIHKYLLGDGWHPNAAGYAIIADNVFNEIAKRVRVIEKEQPENKEEA